MLHPFNHTRIKGDKTEAKIRALGLLLIWIPTILSWVGVLPLNWFSGFGTGLTDAVGIVLLWFPEKWIKKAEGEK